MVRGRVWFNRLMSARAPYGPARPWIAKSDRRMLPLVTDLNYREMPRLAAPDPAPIILIEARIRQWKINWQ